MATERHYYTVANTDGSIIDAQGRYVRDAITTTCGHLHRTIEAAEDCKERLQMQRCNCGAPWSRAQGTMAHYPHGGPVCSAKWYNAKVLRVDRYGRHLPEAAAPQSD